MVAYYNDNDPFVAAWLRELISEGLIAPGEVDTRNIKDVAAADLRGFTQVHCFAGIGGWSYALRLAGVPDSMPVWTGSCPCQPFSVAGKRMGTSDERHLWPDFYRLIKECKPPTVFGEQVASKDGRLWLSGVRLDVEAVDYAFGAADLCAAGVGEEAKARISYEDNTFRWERIILGAPHIRQRLYWVAHANNSIGRALSIAGQNGCDWQDAGWEETHRKFGTRSQIRRLADAERNPGDARRLADEPGEGAGAAAAGPRAEPGRCGMLGGLAYTYGRSEGDGGLQRSGQHGQQPQDGRVGERVAHAAGARQFTPWSGAKAEAWDETRLRRSEQGCWIDCADGKARRVEPGIQPLAHGVPNRVGTLRGAGNAIVPQVAAEFIQATKGVVW